MIRVSELRDWLKEFDGEDMIAIEEGGLMLEVITEPPYEEGNMDAASLDVGGWPLIEADDDAEEGKP